MTVRPIRGGWSWSIGGVAKLHYYTSSRSDRSAGPQYALDDRAGNMVSTMIGTAQTTTMFRTLTRQNAR